MSGATGPGRNSDAVVDWGASAAPAAGPAAGFKSAADQAVDAGCRVVKPLVQQGVAQGMQDTCGAPAATMFAPAASQAIDGCTERTAQKTKDTIGSAVDGCAAPAAPRSDSNSGGGWGTWFKSWFK